MTHSRSARDKLLKSESVHFSSSDTESQRSVDVEWILEAFASGVTSVNLRNAVIRGRLSLQYAVFDGQVSLIGCELYDFADFSRVSFQQNLILSGTAFHRGVSFRGAFIHSDVRLSYAQFLSGNATFADMHVDGNFVALSAKFSDRVRANFRAVTIEKSATFRNTVFGGCVNFDSARIGLHAQFGGAVFKAKASFSAIRVDGTANFAARFSRTTFEDEVSFSLAQLGVGIFCGVSFGRKATFNMARFTGNAVFGPVSSTSIPAAIFEQDAEFAGAQFLSAEFRGVGFNGKANFTGAKFGGLVFFGALAEKSAALFAGETTFTLAEFASRVEFQEVSFLGRTSFESITVLGDAFFSGARFFPSSKPSFALARFAGVANFLGATFEAGVSFFHTSFLVLRLSEVETISGSVFGRQLEIQLPGPTQEIFQANLDLRGCTYSRILVVWRSLLRLPDGSPRIKPYDRQPYVQLEKAFREAGQDEEANKIYLERRHIERERIWPRRQSKTVDPTSENIGEGLHELGERGELREFGEPGHHELRELAEHEIHPQPRPRTLTVAATRGIFWLGDWLYWRGVNYGVRPLRLILFATLLLALGTVVFHHPGAVRPKSLPSSPVPGSMHAADQGCPQKLTFWESARVSFREFLPVDLPLLKDCEASDQRRLLFRFADWATILKITGWIIVPVGIAALTGLLRRVAG